jgi:AraC-like DNA-binding protein
MADWSIVVPHAEVSRIPLLMTATPHPKLAGHVLSYTGNDYSHDEPMDWQIAPLGAITVSFDLESPAHTLHPVCGLRDRPLTMHGPPGKYQGMSIGLTPMAAYALLRVPLSEVANATVDVTDILGARVKELIERLRECGDWAERFRIVDRHLLRWLDGGPELARPVFGAWHRLTVTGGRIPISALADEVGWTRQHLVTRFRQQIGLTPKTVARVLRLHRAAVMMVQPSPPPWSEIAHRCGYADQAHLNRDFRALTGTTPTEYVPTTPPPFLDVSTGRDARPSS